MVLKGTIMKKKYMNNISGISPNTIGIRKGSSGGIQIS